MTLKIGTTVRYQGETYSIVEVFPQYRRIWLESPNGKTLSVPVDMVQISEQHDSIAVIQPTEHYENYYHCA